MVPDINLLPKSTGPSPRSRLFTMIAALVFILLLVFLIFQYGSLTKSINSLEVEQQMLETEKTALEAEVVSLESIDAVDLETAVIFIESVSYPVSPLLIEINKYIVANAYLREFKFSETEIEFSVDFETMVDVVEYVGDLTGSIYFNDVKVEEITTFNPTENEEEEKTTSFDEVERFTNKITVTIDPAYILAGGDLE